MRAKCKGMNLQDPETAADFVFQQRKFSTATVVQLQWSRLAQGEPTVYQHLLPKTTSIIPKRFVFPSGETRPLTDIAEYLSLQDKRLVTSEEGGQIFFKLL